MNRRLGVVVCPLVLLLLVFGLAACGGGGSSTGSSSESTETTETAEGKEETGSKEESGGADVAAAEAQLAEYTGHPSTFPVDEPLKKKPPADASVGIMRQSSPIGSLVIPIFEEAAKALGVKSIVVPGGTSATQNQSAAESLIQQNPSVFVNGAYPISTLSKQLEQAKSQGIPIIANGLSTEESEESESDAFVYGSPSYEVGGELMADWVIAHQKDGANAIFYSLPEVAIVNNIEEGFKRTYEEKCPECKVKYVPITLAELGTKAPQKISSELQADPSVNATVFGSFEIAEGLVPLLEQGGLEVETLGFGPTPAELEGLKNEELTMGVGVDLPVNYWTTVDAAARLITGQPVPENEKNGYGVLQVLEPKDITFDTNQLWTGYPDYKERFEALWNGEEPK